MTPLFLLDALQRRLETLFSGISFPDADGAERGIHVYQMALPSPAQAQILPREDEDADAPDLDDYIPLNDGGYTRADARRIFPCVVLKPLAYSMGEVAKDEEDLLTVALTVGAFEDSSDNAEGGRIVVTLLEKIRYDLETSPLLDKKYECGAPSGWELMDLDTRPFWFGEMTTSWTIRKAKRLPALEEDFRVGFYPTERKLP